MHSEIANKKNLDRAWINIEVTKPALQLREFMETDILRCTKTLQGFAVCVLYFYFSRRGKRNQFWWFSKLLLNRLFSIPILPIKCLHQPIYCDWTYQVHHGKCTFRANNSVSFIYIEDYENSTTQLLLNCCSWIVESVAAIAWLRN